MLVCIWSADLARLKVTMTTIQTPLKSKSERKLIRVLAAERGFLLGLSLLVTILLAVTGFVLLQYKTIREQMVVEQAVLQSEVAEAKTHFYALKQQKSFLSGLDQVVASALNKQVSSHWLTSERPVELLTTDLLNHPELIPYQTSSDQPVKFIGKTKMNLMGNRWLVAAITDGQKQGEVVFGYSIDDQGNITWEAIDSFFE